jgi:hypothetical protein
VARCMLDSALAWPAGPGPLCTDDKDPNTSFYGLMNYGWAPNQKLGMPVKYLEIMPGDVIYYPNSIVAGVNAGFFPSGRKPSSLGGRGGVLPSVGSISPCTGGTGPNCKPPIQHVQ